MTPHDTPPIIRIERAPVKAKKARPDKDAAWLMAHLATAQDEYENFLGIPTRTSESRYNSRIRAIAKRLNGGVEP